MSMCKGCDCGNKDDKRLFWLVTMNSLLEGAPDLKMRDVLESIIKGLTANVKYVSIIDKDGNNRLETEGCKCDDIVPDEYIEEFDDDGVLDIEMTAKTVLSELWDNGAIFIVRYSEDMYDVLEDKDKSWLKKIIDSDEEE